MKLYVVVSGIHCFYEAVFSTKEKAKAFVAKQWHPEDYDIFTERLDYDEEES